MEVDVSLFEDWPPTPLRNRAAWVQLEKLNTLVIPHDLEVPSGAEWFSPESNPIRDGNAVGELIDGAEVFGNYAAEIGLTAGAEDFIYCAGLLLYLDFSLRASHSGDVQNPTVGEMLAAAAGRGVQVRVMLPVNAATPDSAMDPVLNEFRKGHNARTVNWINAHVLPDGAAILDGRYLPFATHHQKFLIVYRQGRLTAFCGGADINPDRTQKIEHGSPLHDVQCRIQGPAAWDVLETFRQRWDDYVAHAAKESLPWLRQLADLRCRNLQPPERRGDLKVQICRTYGNFPYDFASGGETSILSLISTAIRASQRFIYIEDQYLVNMELAELLAQQMPYLNHVTIVIPSITTVNDLPQCQFRRTKFVDRLRASNPSKVRVYCARETEEASCGSWVHSKLWIFDDSFAVIGSACCNRRSMTHDSEISAGIYDPSRDDRLNYNFAHRLRIKLWAHHLGMATPDGFSELADGVASSANWLEKLRPAAARIIDFDDDARAAGVSPASGPEDEPVWNVLLDPDGRRR